MTPTYYRPLITTVANAYALDPFLVEAVVWCESRGQADAFRFEPRFWDRYKLATKPPYAGQNPRRVSSSYGLMQIMYVVAHEMGFDGEPEMLFVPRVNLHWGCKKLKTLVEWSLGFGVSAQEARMATLAAYNGGKGGNTPGTSLRPENRKYAERVLAAHRLYLDGLQRA